MLNKLFDSLSFFFSNPKKVMWLAFILGVVFSVISIVCITGYNNDAGLYIAMAHSFAIGDWSRAFLDNIPPLVPVMSGLITMLGLPPWDSGMIVGCAFYVLTIFPLYGLLCFFMDKKYAAWGALFYLLAPKMMRLGMSPMLEGARMFFYILPVYFTFSFAKDKKIYKLILLGVSLALLALVRGEGIISMPFILLALFLLCIKKNKYKTTLLSLLLPIAYCLFAFLVMLAVLSPRLYQNYIKTGYPTLDNRQAECIQKYYDKIFNRSNMENSKAKKVEIPKLKAENQISDNESQEVKIGTASYYGKFFKNIFRGTYELYTILCVIGMVILALRKEWKLEHSLLILFGVINAILFALTGSIQYRYYLVNIMLIMPFILTAYLYLFEQAGKFRVQKILVLAVLIVSIAQIINGMDNSLDKSKYYTMEAGYYLKEYRSGFRKDSNGYPTVFILGTDCGTNLFTDFNVMNPGRSKFWIGKFFSPGEALKGIESRNCLSVAVKTPSPEILKPGAILVFNPEEEPQDVAYLRNQPNIKEVKLPDIRETLLFKVN